MYLLLNHPLIISLVVFLVRIIISLSKYYESCSTNLFVYLFVIVYSGGLLLILLYISSLVPNFKMSDMKLSFFIFLVFFIIFSVYTEKYFYFIYDFGFWINSFSVISFVLNFKELFLIFIFVLMFVFCFVSSILNMFKYPIRSL